MTTISRLILCVAALGITGCAVEQETQWQSASRSRSDAVASPAKEQVLRGLAEVVVTDRVWSSFDEASANRITTVNDGSPLFVNIRTSRPLGDLALPADPNGRYTFSPYPHLYLHIGDDTSLRSLSTCYITLGPEDLGRRELVVPLAPLAYRPGGNPTDCWLAAAVSSRPGARTYEIRLAGLAARMQNWLPIADLFAVEQVLADYNAGTAGYAAMLASPPEQPAPQAGPALARAAPGSIGTSAVGPVVSRVPGPPIAREAVVPLSRLSALSPPGVPAGSPTSTATSPAPLRAAAPAREVPTATREVPAPLREAQGTGQLPARIVIHHHDGDAAAVARAYSLRDVLAARPGFNVEVRPVPALVSADNIRIFFEADRDTANAARDLVAGGTVPIRDFTDYRPLPRPGTIELWLAPRGDAGNSPSR